MKQYPKPDKKFHFSNDYWEEPRVYDAISLYQIGDINCNKNYSIEEHMQKCYEISYIVSGSGWFSINNRRYTVKAGDIFINLPQQLHSGKADSENPFRFFYMSFSFNYQPYQDNVFTHIQKMLSKAESPLMQDRFEIRDSFQQVLKEIYKENEYSELMINSYLQQIIIKTYRDFCSDWEQTYIPSQKLEGNQSIVQGVINYFDDNILNINELTQISKALGYSYSYLSHVFSEETGLTLQAYYAQKRIEKAMELLQNEEYNITTIADKLQYQSIHSFSKAFKKIIGVSPAQYHKKQKQKSEQIIANI